MFLHKGFLEALWGWDCRTGWCMNAWYNKHQESPYPTNEKKQEIVQTTSLTVSQVTCWFANECSRCNNTWKISAMGMIRKVAGSWSSMRTCIARTRSRHYYPCHRVNISVSWTMFESFGVNCSLNTHETQRRAYWHIYIACCRLRCPHGLLMLWNCFLDFAVEYWFGCHATEPDFAGDIGAIEPWLIDWLIDCVGQGIALLCGNYYIACSNPGLCP